MDPPFEMFSFAHLLAIVTLFLLALLLFFIKKMNLMQFEKVRPLEVLFGISLLVMDIFYHVWMIQAGRWDWSSSLPLELCSISLVMAIILLWTRNKHVYDFVFFAGIGGALQAVATPVLDIGFPHFRYFHFFYTHAGIILTALYFTWVRGYRPTFKGIVKTMIALNILLPCVFTVNYFLQGNYMFLNKKPINGSLLDFLGPYPWYILSLEIVAFIIFSCLWFLFRRKEHENAES
ncbi:TIGR02206 family membrane protein [Bacillus sp. FJAT-22090]|uniref:YwaF family protein n=1 Tax=Bacillus sp. FJAT-22090 TaxID=1581038 RepID=UPI0021B420D8|nr:TIGR02206 family membrane protein [Bacillus sp. FJAT-22090]